MSTVRGFFSLKWTRVVFGLLLAFSQLTLAPMPAAAIMPVIARPDGYAVEVTHLVPDDTAQAVDYFGSAVAISGEWAVAGAPTDDPYGVASAGSVTFFKRGAHEWAQAQEVFAGDYDFADQFGNSVAIDGDTAVVGAYSDNENGDNAGAAYVFRYDGAWWQPEGKLIGSGIGEYDYFGISVDVSGDTVVVGARTNEGAINAAGSVYVFTRSGTVWSEQQRLTMNTPGSNLYFGDHVAIDGDTVVAGSHAAETEGRAFVYERTDTTWSIEETLTPSDPVGSDQFGWAVDTDGDTIAVGAPYRTGAAVGAGAVYVFARSGEDWPEQQRVTSPGDTPWLSFGNAVGDDLA